MELSGTNIGSEVQTSAVQVVVFRILTERVLCLYLMEDLFKDFSSGFYDELNTD